MSVDESLMCSFQILKPGDKKAQANSNSRKVRFFYYFQKTFINKVCELKNNQILDNPCLTTLFF